MPIVLERPLRAARAHIKLSERRSRLAAWLVGN